MIIKIVKESEVDDRKPCQRNGHNFVSVAVPTGVELKPFYGRMMNVNPWTDDNTNPFVVPVYCTLCGEYRKLVF